MLNVYKKAVGPNGEHLLVKMYVEKNTQHNIYRKENNINPIMAKHRCKTAFVGWISNIATGEDYLYAESFTNPPGTPPVKYEVGKMVTVKDYDENENKICASGIHFFLSRTRAVMYKDPFQGNFFKVWYDNGAPRYHAEIVDNRVFDGMFYHYNREGRLVREIEIKKNYVIKSTMYLWKPVLIYDRQLGFCGKTEFRKYRERIDIPNSIVKLEDYLPEVKVFLS